MNEIEEDSVSKSNSLKSSTSFNDSANIIIDNAAKYRSDKALTDNSVSSISSHIKIQNFINITKTEHESVNIQRQNNIRSKNLGHSSQKASPSLSLRSNASSIVSSSLDENEIESSVVESDSEAETSVRGDQYVVTKLGDETKYESQSADIPNIGRDMIVLSQKITPTGAAGPLPNPNVFPDPGKLDRVSNAPRIGSIALTNSTDVTFGDKHFYEGPVTIQQFLVESREKWKQANGKEDQDGPDKLFFNQHTESKQAEVGPSRVTDLPPKSSLLPYRLVFNRKASIITIASIFTTLLIAVLVIAASFLFPSTDPKSKLLGDGDDSRQNIPIISNIGSDYIGSGKVLRIIPRDGWLAQPPSSEPIALQHPIPNVVIISTQTEGCETQAACTYRVRFIQTFNIESTQYDDIIYNFLIGGDGNVYEGRGWNNIGAHLKGHNHNSISLAFIGTFRKQQPSSNQMNVTGLLLEEGVRLGKLSSSYKIIGANSIEPTSTATSADSLYASFKNWKHWSEL